MHCRYDHRQGVMSSSTAEMKSFPLNDLTEDDEGGAAEESKASQALILEKLQLAGAPAGAAAAAAAAGAAGDEEVYQDEHICIKVVSRPGFTCAIQASARLGMPPRALFKQIITHPGWPACLPACLHEALLQEAAMRLRW